MTTTIVPPEAPPSEPSALTTAMEEVSVSVNVVNAIASALATGMEMPLRIYPGLVTSMTFSLHQHVGFLTWLEMTGVSAVKVEECNADGHLVDATGQINGHTVVFMASVPLSAPLGEKVTLAKLRKALAVAS
jgi:hypothetical protein